MALGAGLAEGLRRRDALITGLSRRTVAAAVFRKREHILLRALIPRFDRRQERVSIFDAASDEPLTLNFDRLTVAHASDRGPRFERLGRDPEHEIATRERGERRKRQSPLRRAQ
jgi:hypothetical protein